MSEERINPVTDELVRKLYARNDTGWEKYGQPLHPWDGRNTENDIEEELLDALQYVTKMRMERAELADLLERVRWPFVLAEECHEMAKKLRADVWRVGGAK